MTVRVSFSSIVGQERARDFLKEVLAREKMPHAYLFTGIPGVGKTSMARALALALNCEAPEDGDSCGRCPACRRMLSGNFPDFVSVRCRPDKQKILIEQIRDLNRELRFPPHSEGFRVCVVQEAERMTEEAANAFLKTLEEPPPRNILILNTVEPRDLLSTIVSRCQRVSFRPLPRGAMAKWLAENMDVPGETGELLARISGGSLGLARKMLAHHFLETREKWISRLLEVPGLTRERCLDMAGRCESETGKGAGIASRDGTPGLTDLIDVWETWYRDLLVLKSGGSAGLLMNVDFSHQLKKISKSAKLNLLSESIRVMDRARQDLHRNRNRKLVMEYLVLSLNRLAGGSL